MTFVIFVWTKANLLFIKESYSALSPSGMAARDPAAAGSAAGSVCRASLGDCRRSPFGSALVGGCGRRYADRLARMTLSMERAPFMLGSFFWIQRVVSTIWLSVPHALPLAGVLSLCSKHVLVHIPRVAQVLRSNVVG